MDNLVFIAILSASILHASWHAKIKSTGNKVISLAGMNVISGLASLTLLPFTNPIPSIGFGIIVGSVFLHIGYKLMLARLYRVTDLGQAYPLARGLTPIASSVLAYFVFGESPNFLAIFGIGLICGGLILLAFERSGAHITTSTFGIAFLTSLAVTCYSVVDAYGIRLTGDVFSYTVWLISIDSILFVAYATATYRNQALKEWISGWKNVVASGCFGLISFCVFMWALGRAPVGAVSALREASVIFATLIGAFSLGEHANWKRYCAASTIAVGVGVIALAR